MRYCVFILLLLFPATSSAAELRLDQPANSVRVGDTFTAPVFLGTGTDVINAIEGSIHFSSQLSLVDIRLTGSLVPLWIASPSEKEKRTVSFAGVLPGGYQGEGSVVTLVFKATGKGAARIFFGEDTAVYKNDGKGTKAKLTLSTTSFTIGDSIGTPRTVSLEDVLPPEPFIPVVSPGEPFGLKGSVLLFTTQDKNSGISHYEIARSYYPKAAETSLSWHTIESPYVLLPGDTQQYLYVRAVDTAGNSRIAIVPPQEFSFFAFLIAWWWLLLLVAIVAVILFSRFGKR